LRLFPATGSGWSPEVIPCSALEKTGIDAIWDMVLRYVELTRANRFFDAHRNQQAKYWMYETIHEQLRDRFYQDPEIIKMIAEVEKKVLANEISSFAGAKILLDQYATKS